MKSVLEINIWSFRKPNIYFPDIFGFLIQFLETFQSQKGYEMVILLLMKVISRPQPRVDLVARMTKQAIRGLELSVLFLHL